MLVVGSRFLVVGQGVADPPIVPQTPLAAKQACKRSFLHRAWFSLVSVSIGALGHWLGGEVGTVVISDSNWTHFTRAFLPASS